MLTHKFSDFITMIAVSMRLVYRLAQESRFVIDHGVSTAYCWPSSGDCSLILVRVEKIGKFSYSDERFFLANERLLAKLWLYTFFNGKLQVKL